MFFYKVKEEVEVKKDEIYDARKLGVLPMLVLGAQHMCAFFGATVLVALLSGLPVQTTLFCAGLCTLVFHYFFGKRIVPVFLGSSFAFLGGYAIVKECPTYAGLPLNDQLAYANGGAIIGAFIYVIVSIAIMVVGERRVLKYLPTVVTGPMVICIGMSLVPSAISNASNNWLLAIITIAIVIAFSVWGKGVWGIASIFMGFVLSYAVAMAVYASGVGGNVWEIDLASVASANWFGLPPIIFPKFGVEATLIMAPIYLATMMEHIGDMSAISATVGQNFMEEPGLHRTLLGDAVASILSLLLGGPSNTTYGENTGVLALTKVYDPRVIRIGAAYAVIIGFMPKFAALINTMPAAIIGGVSFILYGMVAIVGVRNIQEKKVDFSKSRNLIIASIVIVCGLGFSDGISFPVFGVNVTLTGLAIAAIVGILLNMILPGQDDECETDKADGDSGGIAKDALSEGSNM